MKIRNDRTTTYLLIAILLVAAILRLNHINQPYADVFSWRQSDTAIMADNFYRKNWNIFYPGVSWNGPEPNYQGCEFQTATYISALLYILVGQHDWVGRGVAVTFGLWGIFALYQLVRRVWDKERAIASAAVMAVLPGSIFIERSFIPDPVMVALVVTSFWLLVSYLQTERWHYLVLASLIGTWGFLTKLPGLIVGIPMIYAMLAILGRKQMLRSKKLATIGIAAVFTLTIVITYYLWARHLSLTHPPYHITGGGNWLWDDGLAQWFSQNYFLPKLSSIFRNWMWTTFGIALVLLGLLLPLPKKENSQDYISDLPYINSPKAPWLFHWWMLGGLIFYFFGARELVNNPWNFHILNPAAAALAGHALIVIASFTTRIARLPTAIIITILFLFFLGMSGQKALKYNYYPYADTGYKLGLELRQRSQPNDLVVTIANDIGDPVAIYYSKQRGWVFPPAASKIDWSQLPEDDNQAIRLLEELRAKGADWFGIVDEHKKELRKKYPKFMEHLDRTCNLEKESSEFLIYRIPKTKKVAISRDYSGF